MVISIAKIVFALHIVITQKKDVVMNMGIESVPDSRGLMQ